MYGKLTLVGRLGADPEMKYTPSGTAVTELRVAVDQGYGDNKKTLWVTVKAWGKRDGTGGMAEAAATYLHKGSLVFVEGTPTVRAYVANGGEARGVLEVNANELKFLDGKQDNGNGEARPAQQAKPATANANQQPTPQAATTNPYQQISPDGNFGWDGKAWVAIPKTAAPPPPPPTPEPVHDVDPDSIPF